MNLPNFGPFCRAESIILWTSTISTGISVFGLKPSVLLVNPPTFSKSTILSRADPVSACVARNGLFFKIGCLIRSVDPLSWPLLTRVSRISVSMFISRLNHCSNYRVCSSSRRPKNNLVGGSEASPLSSSQSSTIPSTKTLFVVLVKIPVSRSSSPRLTSHS